jgi:excisionase family DNA binding protein
LFLPGSRDVFASDRASTRRREAGVSDRLLTAAEVAELLGVPERWIRDHTRNGRLPHVVLGRYRRYSWPDVQAWLETQKTGGARFGKHRPTVDVGAGR